MDLRPTAHEIALMAASYADGRLDASQIHHTPTVRSDEFVTRAVAAGCGRADLSALYDRMLAEQADDLAPVRADDALLDALGGRGTTVAVPRLPDDVAVGLFALRCDVDSEQIVGAS